jgi:hypothetical protein
MDELIAFYAARLDEDERDALAASPGPWSANAEHDEIHSNDGIPVAEGFALSGRQLRATVDHIVRHDPDRVLRRVKSGRELIKLCEKQWTHDLRGTEGGLEMALELAVYEYADHADYLEKWRP